MAMGNSLRRLTGRVMPGAVQRVQPGGPSSATTSRSASETSTTPLWLLSPSTSTSGTLAASAIATSQPHSSSGSWTKRAPVMDSIAALTS